MVRVLFFIYYFQLHHELRRLEKWTLIARLVLTGHLKKSLYKTYKTRLLKGVCACVYVGMGFVYILAQANCNHTH